MNAPAAFPTPVDAGSRGDPADAFVGRFLKKVAEFEIWMVEQLVRDQPEAKIEKLVSQRLAAFRTALKTRSGVVRDRELVQVLLDRLQPYLELRAELAHARSTRLTDAHGEPLYLFETACPDPDHPWQVRTVLRGDEFAALRQGLSDLVNQLRQQTPRD